MDKQQQLNDYIGEYIKVKDYLTYLQQLEIHDGLSKRELEELNYLTEQEKGLFNEINRLKIDLLINDDDGRKVVDADIKLEINHLKNQNLKFLDYLKHFNPVQEVPGQKTINNRDKLVYKRLNKLDKKSDDKVKNVSAKVIAKVEKCACRLTVATDDTLQKRKIIEIIRCNNRFCPFCSKSKSIIDGIALQSIYSYLQDKNYKFIFLTLTVPNVVGSELNNQIKKLYKAFDLMFKYKKVKKIVKGYTTKIEVTYNKEKNTYHPHLHVIITIEDSYFINYNYISHTEWLRMWQKATRNDKITQVDVRRPKNKNNANNGIISSEIMELTKYIAKDSDYLNSERVFRRFYNGLKGVRMYRHGGVNRDAVIKFKNEELIDYITDEQVEYVYKFIYRFDYQQKLYSRTNDDIKRITPAELLAIINARKKNIVKEYKNNDNNE